MSSEKLKTRPILSAATISLFLTALLYPIYSSNVEAHTGRLSHPSIFSSHEFPNSQYHPLRSSSFHNSSHPVSLPGDDKDDYVHPIFICFFVFYFFGFSLVFCYAIHLLGSKFGKWYRNYRTKRKQQSNSNEYYSTIRNRSHSNQSGRMDMVTLSSEQQHHTTIANHTISNNYLYPNNQSNHSLQYLFYIQIVPYFLIRFLIYFLIGFELIPKDYFDIENNWAHSQIFLVAFSLSGILLHNSYFLIAFFWSELESVKRGIPTRQIKPLLIFITCSLIWFGAEIAMAILVFVKCYPNLYSPSSNTKSMWNLNFDEGLKYLKRKSLTQKTKRMMNHLQNDTSSGGGAHGGGTIGQDDDDTKHPHVMDETSHLLVSKSNHIIYNNNNLDGE
ncbi:hypothetical protein C9374_002706 [Naegleria lovaniensis]|uniref:Uncharacterized protein n=1 Tax=Naegleria lovaniensis TaxID=51637 RepID=A0AA88KK17_NAELO|nr:uncharacterized protein C9374_002706 [Naegleria lovaniensis]KAG2386260.1 hypothetical protein C9374_002706 [Naegleria lovaniensis]